MSDRITVDWTRCDGHGLCTRLFPERIAQDDWGFPVVDPRGVADAELAQARLAVRSCPRLALTIERGPVERRPIERGPVDARRREPVT